MAEAKKKAPAKKAEPAPTEVEGFTTKDYEGNELYVCDRCGFDTFNTALADQHTRTHKVQDAEQAEQADITEHLAERAQVTVEDVTDEG